MADDDPHAALAALAGSQEPWLFGVRHHSPACAAAMPAWLERARPQRILLELPPELGSWLPWLGHPELEAPVALAAASEDGSLLSFYPFANFSPELVAVRWAIAHGVPIVPFDLPLAARGGGSVGGATWRSEGPALLPRLGQRLEAGDTATLWERLVEARAPGAEPEAIRRAALLAGWALRLDAARSGGIDGEDLRREAYMRSILFGVGSSTRTVAVIGAFHAAALLPEPLLFAAPGESEAEAEEPAPALVTSLIPYGTDLLDSRSGYPAGILDPLWQERLWAAMKAGSSPEDVVAELVAEVCARMRAQLHVAGVPDAREALRLALDLARLRGLPAAGRRELLEALETALGQGELLGRGRVLARVLEGVMVGKRRGRLAKGTPRSGLAPHVEALLEELGLPGPHAPSQEPKRLRLDPLRSPLDARRRVVLARLRACGIPYGEPREEGRSGANEALTEVWELCWRPATEAMLELCAASGSTLEQATTGALRRAQRRSEGERTARGQLDFLAAAAQCALLVLTAEALAGLLEDFAHQAGLAEVIEALEWVEKIARGHLPLVDPAALRDLVPLDSVRAELLAATLRAVEGLAGSDRQEDALALLEVTRLFGQLADHPQAPGAARLGWALDLLAAQGSPRMQGAAGAARVLVGRESGGAFGIRAGSWVDAALEVSSLTALAKRLQGLLAVAAPLFEADPDWAAGLLDRVEASEDQRFLRQLPALREGFSLLSPAARQRLLEALEGRLVDAGDLALEVDALWLAECAAADLAGAAAVLARGSGRLPAADTASVGQPARAEIAPQGGSPRRELSTRELSTRELSTRELSTRELSPSDRWRLLLGRERDKLSSAKARRAARALEDLYGTGSGEGSRDLFGAGAGGGREDGFPSVRDWAVELEDVFGVAVREEVLGLAASRGHRAAALELDPATVSPSVELLEQVLALRGGLAEAQLEQLRRLVQRVVDQLVEALAVRVRPALTGLTLPRPTRRPTGRLDLRRTVAANLAHLRRDADSGQGQLVAERLIFKTRGRRAIDWRIILVVDVSGSMEASVIYSAMMAAILHGLPAVSVHFLAFNTHVLDLSQRVGDPLGLLLEVQVGGGTHLARGLAYARSLLSVPARSLVLAVTDFEEGFPVEGLLAEVRALAESGAKLLGLAALDDRGQPRYHRAIAEMVVAAGMPVAALSPLELARWIGEQIR